MTTTVEIAMANSPDEAYDIRDWVYANVGDWESKSWSVTVRQQWYVFEFEDERDAMLFLLRWA